MFKGLRTKIESEQKGQARSTVERGLSTPSATTIKTNLASTTTPSQNKLVKGQDPLEDRQSMHVESNVKDKLISPEEALGVAKTISSISSPDDTRDPVSFDSENQVGNVEDLRGQISKLQDQLKLVIREKDDSNEQNAQLYQLIEKLRRKLETEHEISSGLRQKLNELEVQLTEKTEKSIVKNNNLAFNKSFNLDERPVTSVAEPNATDTALLQNEIIELQAQLAKKNRQLRIRQQNLNDIKRTLQKEILDHGRTQDELQRLKKQLHTNEQASQDQQRNRDTDASTPQNGSHGVESSDTNQKDILNQSSSDRNQGQSINSHFNCTFGEDTMSLNATPGSGSNLQFDKLSCLSRSSASVDDFESNDLQQSNYSKEVSHEYLKNVLYRYMISTDSETSQHLVKAISVLLEFSPEQSAAIKRVMNSRSSWLRLK